MNIQVIGSGCPKCKKLYELTKTAVEQVGSEASVEYSTDVTKIIQMNVMASPVLAIDGKPVVVGYLPDLDTIKQFVQEAESVA
jgi:small redox-active disulfide protein 2